MGLIKMYAREIKYLVNGPGTEETATGYVASPVRYSTIDVSDLADHIAADSRIERSKVAVITDSLIKQIREMVLNGHKITVPHLGSFKPKIKSTMAINPESVDAATFTARVAFRPSAELKTELQSARIEKTTLVAAPDAPTIEEQKANALALMKPIMLKIAKAWIAENISQAAADEFDADPVFGTSPATNLQTGMDTLISTMILKAVINPETGDNAAVYVFMKAKPEGYTKYMYFNNNGVIQNIHPKINDGEWDKWIEGDDYTYVYAISKHLKFTEPFSVE